MLAQGDEYTSTPAVSHAILTYNRRRTTGLADGIVITPSHNPPHDGGFKHNRPNGGPAESAVTAWIETKANEFLENGLQVLKGIPFEKALRAPTTHRHDYLNAYITELANVLDMDAIRGAKISMGVDPLGGAGIHCWKPIAERYGLNLTVVNETRRPDLSFYDCGLERPNTHAAAARVIDLVPARNRTGDVWHVWIEGIRPGQLYAYRVDGHRFNFSKLLLDPFAAAISHVRNWDFGGPVTTLFLDIGGSRLA